VERAAPGDHCADEKNGRREETFKKNAVLDIGAAKKKKAPEGGASGNESGRKGRMTRGQGPARV